MSEVVKPIPGWPKYLASSTGNIYSIRTGKRKLLKQFFRGGRYLCVNLSTNGVRREQRVHTLVLEAFRGRCPDRMQARHLDGVKANCAIKNLRWGTPAQNTQDKKRHGTWPAGEKNGRAKLTSKDVVEIRKIHRKSCFKNGAAALARKYGVTPPMVGYIVRNVNWKGIAA